MKISAGLLSLALAALLASPGSAQSPSSATLLSRPLTPRPVTVQPQARSGTAKPTQAKQLWVGAILDGVYFRDGCSAVRTVVTSNRRVFPSRIAAEAAGYRRSKAAGC